MAVAAYKNFGELRSAVLGHIIHALPGDLVHLRPQTTGEDTLAVTKLLLKVQCGATAIKTCLECRKKPNSQDGYKYSTA